MSTANVGSAPLSMNTIVLSSSLFENDAMQSSAVRVSISATDSSGTTDGTRRLTGVSASTSVKIVLQNDNSSPVSTDVEVAETHQISCKKGQKSSLNATCPKTSHPLQLFCNGSSTGVLQATCPTLRAVSTCQTLDASKFSCQVLAFTKTNTTCVCTLSDMSADAAVDVASMLAFVSDSVMNKWNSAASLNASNVGHNWRVLVTMGSFLLFTMLMLIGASWKDRLSMRVESEGHKEKAHEKKLHSVFPAEQVYSKQSMLEMKDLDATELIEASMPKAVGKDAFLDRFIRELKIFHRWFGVIFHYSPLTSRVVRSTVLITHVIIVSFLQSVLYDLTQADDGSCSALVRPDTCLAAPSVYNSATTKCVWNLDTSTCRFRTPDSDVMAVVFIAVISSIFSAPLTVIMNYLTMNVLAAPTLASSSELTGPNSRGRLLMSSRDAVADESTVVSGNRKNQIRRRWGVKALNSREAWNLASALTGESCLLGTSLEEDMTNMTAEMKRYRDTLSNEQLREFDDSWGLNDTGSG